MISTARTIILAVCCIVLVSGCSGRFPDFKEWPTVSEMVDIVESEFGCRVGTPGWGLYCTLNSNMDLREVSTATSSIGMDVEGSPQIEDDETIEEFLDRIGDEKISSMQLSLTDLDTSTVQDFLTGSIGLDDEQATQIITTINAQVVSGPFRVRHAEGFSSRGMQRTGRSSGYIFIHQIR